MNISKLPNKLFKQKIFLLIIIFFTYLFHSFFLFFTKRKYNKNYCYTHYSQFETCIAEEFCSQSKNAIFHCFYLDSDLVEENNNSIGINEFYKPFAAEYNYLISSNNILLSNDKTKISNKDKFRFVVITIFDEKWNIFLKYFSICEKDKYYPYIIGIIFIGGFIGSILFGTLADIYGRKKIIIATIFLIILSCLFIIITCVSIEINSCNIYNEFKIKYKISESNPYYKQLEILFKQINAKKIFNSYITLLLLFLFILNLALRPLSNICLSLLLENYPSDLYSFKNFMDFSIFSTCFQLFTMFILIFYINNFMYIFIIFLVIYLILFICSFFILDESIRHLYEYCEWVELTKIIY